MRLQLMSTVTLLVILLSCHQANGQIGDIMTIVQYGWDLLNLNDKLLPKKTDLSERIQEVSWQITQLENNLKVSQTTIINELKSYIRYHATMVEFFRIGNRIDGMYMKFHRYFKNGSRYEDTTIHRFAMTATSHDNNELTSLIDSLHSLVNPPPLNPKGILDMIIEDRETKHQAAQVCGFSISLQQQVYRLYNLIALYIVKGFIMKMYSFVLLKNFDKKQYEGEKEEIRSDYKKIALDIELIARNIMGRASREFRPCDPVDHVEGETYIQLKWLFGATVINEEKLNSEGKCGNECPDYDNIDTNSVNFNTELSKCKGKLYGCFFSRVEGYCPATSDYRRYDGFPRYESDIRKFANPSPDRGNISCSSPTGLWGDNLWNSYFNSPFGWFTDCDDCICYCDDFKRSETVRTFSTRIVRSNINENKVITGIKLVERGRMIYIQIQEGKLGASGIIDKSTVAWKEIDEFDFTNPLTPSSDYLTITNFDNYIFFDTITGGSGQVLTGIGFDIKFLASGNRDRAGISMKIEVTQFNLKQGTMTSGNTEEIKVGDHSWSLMQLKRPHIPTSMKDNIANSENNKVLGFRQTDWEKDAAQTAIPFIDSQPIISNPPFPLSGAGMFHKGQDGSGGFLALKLVTYNITEFIITPDLNETNFSSQYSASATAFELPNITQFWGVEPFDNTTTVQDDSFDFCKYI